PRLAVAGEQAPARQLVARPFADDGRREIADVVLVEHEQRAQARPRKRLPRATEAIRVQPAKVDALLEVHLDVSGRGERPVPAVPGIHVAGGITPWCRGAARPLRTRVVVPASHGCLLLAPLSRRCSSAARAGAILLL